MVNNNSNYFYLSGFISFSIFFFFISASIFMMLKNENVQQFALNKDSFISITIQAPKPILKKKKIIEPIKPIESKEINVDDLFSDVQTKVIKTKKQEPKRIDAKRLQEISKKISTTKENKVEKMEQIKELDTKSSALEVNEYFAKIQSTVYESFYPPDNSQGNTVEAVIELNSLGKVIDFRILIYSSNSYLNEECDKIKQRLLGINFPVNPDGISGTYKINLTSQGIE